MIAMRRHPRPAFTLLEMILVVAIIMIAAALSLPVAQALLDDARETAAADMIRGKTAEARARAMETGKAWRLAFLPGTGVIQIAPDDSDEWGSSDHSTVDKDDLSRDEMPKNVVIGSSVGDIQGATSAGSGGAGWQTIAVYLYDGSVRADSDQQVLTTYFGKAGTAPMAVQIRVFTGSSAVLSAKETMESQP
jgi:type II secretory pathway pseudopilin PulG